MGSTNSTKNASKLSAVKALAKSLMGNRKDTQTGKDTKKKGAAPAKSAAAKPAPKAATKPAAKTAASPAAKAVASKAQPAIPSKTAAKAPANKKGAETPAPKANAKAAAPAAASKKAALASGEAKSAKAARAEGRKGAGSSYGRGNMDAEAVCREVACEGLSTTAGYCRLHYIKNWKKIKRKELILKEGKLNQYIEELVAKYPDKYIDAIRQDLANDKDFAKVIYDLDLDESVDDFDIDGENMDSLIDTIKRDFDDEGEGGF